MLWEFVDKYKASVEQHLPVLRDGRPNPTLIRIEQLKGFLKPYYELSGLPLCDHLKSVACFHSTLCEMTRIVGFIFPDEMRACSATIKPLTSSGSPPFL